MLPSNVLETQLLLKNTVVEPTPIQGVAEQEKHAVSPEDYKAEIDVWMIIYVLGGFYILMWLLQLLERKLS